MINAIYRCTFLCTTKIVTGGNDNESAFLPKKKKRRKNRALFGHV